LLVYWLHDKISVVMELLRRAASSLFWMLLLPCAALAGEADVIAAKAKQTSPGVWRISATLRHADEGWDHYADRWEVLLDGEVIATRILAHPHVNEQPFTRSLDGVSIPTDACMVTIRAHDKVHGYGGAVYKLTLER